jgi:hypothetical protein
MGIAARILQFRCAGGHTESAMASTLGLTLHGYCDLEQHDDEFETVLGIAQALRLAAALNTRILDILGERCCGAPIPIAEVRRAVLELLKRPHSSREAIETELGWDLGPLLQEARFMLDDYTIMFLKDLSGMLDLDWRCVLDGADAV